MREIDLGRKVRAICSAVLDHSPEAKARRRVTQRAIERGNILWQQVKQDFASGKEQRTMAEIDADLDAAIAQLGNQSSNNK